MPLLADSPHLLPVSIPEQQLEVEEIEDRYNSSSSPSSIFSIPPEDDPHLLSQLGGVLREGTATPSESQGIDGGGKSGDRSKSGGKDGGTADGETPDNQDVNSEPNDSSAEEESGEDSQTLMENLSLKLEESRPELGTALPGDEFNLFLAMLRKKVLTWLVDNVGIVEDVGGMRAMCYLQVGWLTWLIYIPDIFSPHSFCLPLSSLPFVPFPSLLPSPTPADDELDLPPGLLLRRCGGAGVHPSLPLAPPGPLPRRPAG